MNVTTGPAFNFSSALPSIVPGNSIQASTQGATVLQLPALGTIQPFAAVSIGINGCTVADPTATNFTTAPLGIALGSYSAGALAGVALEGIVVNTSTGIGGWNLIIGAPVFVGSLGIITQTLPLSGFALSLGYAISANAILLQAPVQMQQAFPLYENSSIGASVTISPALTLTGAYITLSQPNTQITLNPGLFNGQSWQLQVQQSASGNNVYSFIGAIATFTSSFVANKSEVFEFRWLSSKGEWIAIGMVTGI